MWVGKYMNMRILFLRAGALLVVASALSAACLAQVTWTKGQIWRGKPGITETVAQIMRRDSTPPFGIQEIKDVEEGPGPRGLPQNPASPEVSRFPYFGQETPIGGGIIDYRPLFSIGPSWTGGVSSESGFIPPDSMGDVSPTQVVMTVNGRIKLFDRAGNVGALNTTTNTFFNSVRNNSTTSDPRCRYDRLSNRWYIVMVNTTSQNNRILIAVSNSGTITDATSFTFYQFNYATPTPAGSATAFWDYPTLGIDDNSVYLGGNIFDGSSRQTDLFVLNKSQLLAGTLSISVFRALGVSGSGAFGPWTPHGIDNDNPTATEGYVLGSDINFYGVLDLRRVTYSGGVPSISSNISITVPSTSAPRAVPAKGSTVPLDALDHRLFAAKMFYNRLTGVGTIWAAQDYGTTSSGVASGSPDRTASRWYELQGYQTGQTPSLVQSGSLFDSAASSPVNYWIPSIAMNGQGYAALCCSAGGANLNANVAFAQRVPTDPLGSLQAPVMITSSAFNYNIQTSGSSQRWGDYSHTSLDPSDGQSLWTFQEFCDANNSWGLRITQLFAPAPTVTNLNPPGAYPYDTVNVVVTGTGIFDGGSTFPNRLSAGVSGTGVTVNTVTFNSATQATVNLTIAAGAAFGGRTLTLKNPDGQSASMTFTVNMPTGTGTVTLGDYSASPSGTPVTFQIVDGSNTTVQTASANLDAAGNYSFTPSVAPGTYTVFAKASHWLRRKALNVTITSAGFSGVNFSLINGDIDGNNAVGLSDFAGLKAAFGSLPGDGNWNPNADLDGNGAVGLSDFAIMKRNFGLIGD